MHAFGYWGQLTANKVELGMDEDDSPNTPLMRELAMFPQAGCGHNGDEADALDCCTVLRNNEQPNHREVKGATAMTETLTDDQPGFVAEESEHCHACHRLIQHGRYLQP
jgi:hypothetical protein